MLRKRDAYRESFARFNPKRVATFTGDDVARLMQNAGIIRNKAKIESAIGNARAFLEIQKECGSFDDFLWSYVDGKPVVRRPRAVGDVPPTSPLSDRLSNDLRKRGFRFVGSTICYAYLQAVGVVNDHLATCFKSLRGRSTAPIHTITGAGGPPFFSIRSDATPLGPASPASAFTE